jgi:hypothetical protein
MAIAHPGTHVLEGEGLVQPQELVVVVGPVVRLDEEDLHGGLGSWSWGGNSE